MTGAERFALQILLEYYDSETKQFRAHAQRWKDAPDTEDTDPSYERGHADGMACACVGFQRHLRELLTATEKETR